MSSPQPKDKELYAKTKEKAKKKFKVYPSIYANSWLVSEYKKAYEKKHGEGKEAYTGKKPKDSGLPKWFDEEWIDLSKSNPDKNKWVQCGRPKANQKKSDWKKDYPKCYPKSKAKKLWKDGGQKAFDDAVKRKRKAVNNPKYKGGKPTYVATKKAEEEKVINQNNQSGFLRDGLLTEAGVIGASLFVVGATLMQFELKGITDKKWWRYAGLFVAGASLHLIYEAFGLNRKYCETAFEAEKINRLDKEFKKLKPKYDTWREKVNWNKKDPKRPRKDDWKKDIEWEDELSLEADSSRGWIWSGRGLQEDSSPASSSTYGGYYSYGDTLIKPTKQARRVVSWPDDDDWRWKQKSKVVGTKEQTMREIEAKEKIERIEMGRENRIYRQDRYFCQRYNDLPLEERPTYSTRYRKRGNRCGNCGSRECLSRAIEYQEDRKRRAKVYGMRDEIIEGGMIPAWFTAETFEAEGKPTSVEIKRSTNKEKKLMAIFTYPDGKTKTTHFGARGMSDYTKHGDKERMERYLDRHDNGREDWNDPTTAGALSRWVLWNKPSLSASFNDFKKRFKLKGELKVKKSAESFEAEDETQAYLMCDWNKKVPYEIHNAGCKHRNFYEKRWESDIDLWNPKSLEGVCRDYIQVWEENLGGTGYVDGEDLDAIAKMTFSQFMRSDYTKTTTPIKLSPCHKQNPKIKDFMDNTLVGDISPLTYLDSRKRAESFEADNCIECGRKEGPYSDTKLVACKVCPELCCQHCFMEDEGCKFCFGKDKYRAECKHQLVLGAEKHYTDKRPMTCPICVGELSSYSKS